MVIGIIGNTQGVKIEAKPNPKATSRNEAILSAAPAGAGVSLEGGGALASVYPAGISRAPAAAAESIFTRASPVHLPGTHWVSLQVWNRPLTVRTAGPAGASFFNCVSTRKVASPS